MHVDTTIIRSFRKELFSRFLPSTYVGHVGYWLNFSFKEGLYRIWGGVNSLGDSGVNTLGDTSAFVNSAG